jgi:rhodanese-related sulfurtransferase
MADAQDLLNKVENRVGNPQDLIKNAKDGLPNVTPTPPDLHAQATAHELKSRLNWGEPALTILDVRDRELFNARHILGAQSMPSDTLVDRAKSSLELSRDIYVYGMNDAETTEAANSLRQAGFTRVAELKGGVDAFEGIGGSVEGTVTNDENLTAGAYNVVARMQEFAAERDKEEKM